jgi:hypothetical protein
VSVFRRISMGTWSLPLVYIEDHAALHKLLSCSLGIQFQRRTSALACTAKLPRQPGDCRVSSPSRLDESQHLDMEVDHILTLTLTLVNWAIVLTKSNSVPTTTLFSLVLGGWTLPRV